MPAIIVGTTAMAAHAEIFRMSSFCCTPTCARCADRTSETSRSCPSTVSFTRVRWSWTSRKYGRDPSSTNGTRAPDVPTPASRASGAASGTVARRNSRICRLKP